MSDTTTKPKTEQQTLAPEPEAKLPALRGGGAMTAIIPQDFEQAYRMARVIAASGAAPKSYLMKDQTDLKEYISVERIAVAIMHGLEVGLPPMAAVQGIAVINGIPTIYGDARDGLIAASGLLEDMKEEMELDDQGLFVWARCTVWRRGRKTPIEQTITRPQAARAGWLKKQGPWQESPNRMAQMRAKGWANRDAFPDVLKGLRDRDEVLDMVDVTPRGDATTTAAPTPRRADFKPAPQPEPEKWELFNEVGEVTVELAAADWSDALAKHARELTGVARATLLENNADTAETICDAIDDEAIIEGIRALYTPAKPEATRPWQMPDNIAGQDARMKFIRAQFMEQAENVDEVDAIKTEHADFIAKLGGKKAAFEKEIADRRLALGGGQ